MQQPPYGYGPPPPSQPGYGPPHGYGQGPNWPPPRKKGMSGGMIALIVFCCLFGSCAMCGVIGSAGKKDTKAAATAAPDPSAAAAQLAAKQKAADDAKAERESKAVESFPTKKSEILSMIKKSTSAADNGRWAQADADLTTAETALQEFRGTSIADSKDFLDLSAKTQALRTKVNPQVEKLAKASASAAAEKELKANSLVVTNSQLFSDYQSNEVAADNKYKGKKLLVTGIVASIDKGPFGGLLLRLASANEFMNTTCDMENSEKGTMATLQKGEQVRVLCKGTGMVIGTPQLDDCVFK